MGCNGLQLEDFWKNKPLTKMKSGLQWAATEHFWEIVPLTKIAMKSGLQWEDFWGIEPLTKIAM